MVFGYYNDTCSNETHLLIALGRGIESVKKWSPVALGQVLLKYTENIFLLLAQILGCRWHHQLLHSNYVIHSTTSSAAIKNAFYICQWIPPQRTSCQNPCSTIDLSFTHPKSLVL